MNPTSSRNNTSSWVDRHHNTENTPLIEMNQQPMQPVKITETPATPVEKFASLAVSELDDLDNDREVLMVPRAGVDDGFFEKPPGAAPTDSNVPTAPPSGSGSRRPSTHDSDQPKLPFPDDIDGRYAPRHPMSPFPHAPGFGPDLENGIIIPDFESIPDVNQYQHRKTLAQGMMDLALFSANANQLRYVLESFDRHPYYYPSVVLISFSILLQIAIGLGLILNSRYNVKNEKEICIANRINNYTVIGIFLVTAVNVFVSAFGVANAPVSVTTLSVPISQPPPSVPLPLPPT